MESQRHEDEHLEKEGGMETHGVSRVDEFAKVGEMEKKAPKIMKAINGSAAIDGPKKMKIRLWILLSKQPFALRHQIREHQTT